MRPFKLASIFYAVFEIRWLGHFFLPHKKQLENAEMEMSARQTCLTAIGGSLFGFVFFFIRIYLEEKERQRWDRMYDLEWLSSKMDALDGRYRTLLSAPTNSELKESKDFWDRYQDAKDAGQEFEILAKDVKDLLFCEDWQKKTQGIKFVKRMKSLLDLRKEVLISYSSEAEDLEEGSIRHDRFHEVCDAFLGLESDIRDFWVCGWQKLVTGASVDGGILEGEVNHLEDTVIDSVPGSRSYLLWKLAPKEEKYSPFKIKKLFDYKFL